MSTIYFILGIVGWTASVVVIAAYIWKGRQSPPRGFEVAGIDGEE